MLNVIAGRSPNDSLNREPVPDYTATLNAGVKGMAVASSAS